MQQWQLVSAAGWHLEQGMDQCDHAGVDLSLRLHSLDLPGLLAVLGARGLAQLQQLIAFADNCAD